MSTTSAQVGDRARNIFKVSRNGQVSIPAEVRARWQADRLVVVDMGDCILMRPAHDDPIAAIAGSYAHLPGPTVDEYRRISRLEDEWNEYRKYGRVG